MLHRPVAGKLAFVVILLAALPARAQLIGFQDCIYSASIGVELPLQMLYRGPDIVAADVRVTGVPIAWIRIVTPPPAASHTAGILFGSGSHVDFPTCTGEPLQLFLITVIPTTVETDVVVSPEKTQDSPIDCPTVTLCDDPVFTVVCTACDRAYINHSAPICPTAVDNVTWSTMRDLYR